MKAVVRSKPPRGPRKSYPGELDAETVAAIDAGMMLDYHRNYLQHWFCNTMHLIAHLRQEAEQLFRRAEHEPDGPVARMGAGYLSRYSTALDNAHSALGSMLPPTTTTPIVLMNVVDELDKLWREKPWKEQE